MKGLVPAAVIALLIAGCAAQGADDRPSQQVAPTGTTQPTPSPTASPLDPLSASHEVAFPARDGVELKGRIFGTGSVGVVLAHGAGPQGGQESWYSFALTLVRHGFRVFTFNFRGTDTSVRPILWRDIAGAVDYLHQQRVVKVFLIGASLGAHMSLCAAAQPGVDIAGVVPVSAGPGGFCAESGLTPSVVGKIHVPALVMAGTRDDLMNTGDAQALYSQAKGPKQLVLLDSSDHGAALLSGPAGVPEKARQAVLDFLAKYS